MAQIAKTIPLADRLACITLDYETDYGDRIGGACNILDSSRKEIDELDATSNLHIFLFTTLLRFAVFPGLQSTASDAPLSVESVAARHEVLRTARRCRYHTRPRDVSPGIDEPVCPDRKMGLMVLHAMMVKNAMSRPWAGWKRFRRKVGDIQARVLLSVFYFVVVAPFALVVKLSSDPLGLSPKTPKEWRPRPPSTGSGLERASRQYRVGDWTTASMGIGPGTEITLCAIAGADGLR